MGIDPNAGFMDKGGMGEGLIKTFTPLGRIEAGINLVTSLFDPSVRDQSMVGRGVGAVLGDKSITNLGFGDNTAYGGNASGGLGSGSWFSGLFSTNPTDMAFSELGYEGGDTSGGGGWSAGSYGGGSDGGYADASAEASAGW